MKHIGEVAREVFSQWRKAKELQQKCLEEHQQDNASYWQGTQGAYTHLFYLLTGVYPDTVDALPAMDHLDALHRPPRVVPAIPTWRVCAKCGAENESAYPVCRFCETRL